MQLFRRLNVLGLCLIVCFTRWCEGAELPVETFFRNYQYDKALLSPDGNYLGVLAPDSNRVGLAIIDLANHQANWAFADRQADVADFFWITTNRLGFRLSRDNYMEGGLMA